MGLAVYRLTTLAFGNRDLDDLAQAARIALWRHQPEDWSLARLIAYRAAIDELRRIRGTGGLGSVRNPRHSILYRRSDIGTDDEQPCEWEWPTEMPRRLREIVTLLANGWTLREVGEVYGVSESRICQLRREAAAIFKRAMTSI